MKESTGRNVFIVEDSLALRARLCEMLADIAGVSVVGEAETPDEAIAGILNTQPHYVVLDYQLKGGTGADVLHATRLQVPGTTFIVLTNYPQPQLRRLCMDAGADAFFDKTSEFGKVKEVIAGGRWIAAERH